MKKPTQTSKRPSNRALRGETPTQRATPAFNLIRALCIRELAFQGKTTEEIANIFQVDRSFIIKQATIVLKPRTDKERVILKVARALATTSRALHGLVFVDLLTGEDIKTPLAGAKTPQKRVKNPPKTPVSRGGKTYQNTPKTPRKPIPKPRKPRLKAAAPQEPLDTRK
jgi:hypothetical protein